MLRFFRRATLILLALVILTFGGASIYVWHLGDEAFHAAEAEGLFASASSNAASTSFETAIQKTWFHQNWKDRGSVCAQISSAWTAVMGGRPEPNEIAIALSNQTFLSLPNHDLTLESHLRRASLACALESRFSNLQMLRFYLRRASFDGKVIGAETASQTVFGKPVGELDADESIMLAALFESGSISNNPAAWNKRADYVRKRLLDGVGRPDAGNQKVIHPS